MPLGKLKPFPGNARLGDHKAIGSSLDEHDLYKPVIVQKSTGYIIAGNNTYLTAQAKVKDGAKEWGVIDVIYLDVDNEEAVEINLVDNYTNDVATYDTEKLGKQLKSIKEQGRSLRGTGFSDEAADRIISAIEGEAVDLSQILKSPSDEETLEEMEKEFDSVAFGEEDNYIPGDEDTPEDGDVATSHVDDDDKDGEFEKSEDEMKGAFTLKDDIQFPGSGFYQIPSLNKAMLVDDIPADLRTWIGKRSFDPDTDDVSDTWWLFNYGLHSSTGIPDLKKVILGFYAWDEHFDPWWERPERYVAKMLNSGITMSLQPDWSLWPEDARAVNIWSLYRNFWLARYMQEAGIKIIPDITWRHDDEKFLREVILPCYPKDMPIAAVQVQTVDKNATKEDLDRLRGFYKLVDAELRPQKYMVYAGPNGWEFFESIKLKTEAQFVEHSLSLMRDKMPKRRKKTI